MPSVPELSASSQSGGIYMRICVLSVYLASMSLSAAHEIYRSRYHDEFVGSSLADLPAE